MTTASADITDIDIVEETVVNDATSEDETVYPQNSKLIDLTESTLQNQQCFIAVHIGM